jgi:hypothetical protein
MTAPLTDDERDGAAAQAEADADGYDRGLEYNTVMRYYRYFMLPEKRNRFGYELRCEVVSCTDYDKIKPGHGP